MILDKRRVQLVRQFMPDTFSDFNKQRSIKHRIGGELFQPKKILHVGVSLNDVLLFYYLFNVLMFSLTEVDKIDACGSFERYYSLASGA